jgi:hypothetical protein
MQYVLSILLFVGVIELKAVMLSVCFLPMEMCGGSLVSSLFLLR